MRASRGYRSGTGVTPTPDRLINVASKLHAVPEKRLRELVKRIKTAKSLKITDFHCRYLICKGDAETRIRAFEAALVARYHPLWNMLVKGFGSHHSSAAHGKILRTEWDMLHSDLRQVGVQRGCVSARNRLKEHIKGYLDIRTKFYAGR